MIWRCVEAFAVGSSHRASGQPCQDRCASSVVVTGGGPVLIAVVSDGAGSAHNGERGAQVVCEALLAVATAGVGACPDLEGIADDDVRGWFLRVRDALRAVAHTDGSELREYAATALLTLAGDGQTVCARIGDGGIVVRRTADSPFEVALWPDAGEYANQTYFITDDAAAEHVGIARFDGVLDVVAFSDGLQHLALERATRSAFTPFFLPLVAAVRGATDGNGKLRTDLMSFLDSAAINDRTDDDKSLVIGCRVGAT